MLLSTDGTLYDASQGILGQAYTDEGTDKGRKRFRGTECTTDDGKGVALAIAGFDGTAVKALTTTTTGAAAVAGFDGTNYQRVATTSTGAVSIAAYDGTNLQRVHATDTGAVAISGYDGAVYRTIKTTNDGTVAVEGSLSVETAITEVALTPGSGTYTTGQGYSLDTLPTANSYSQLTVFFTNVASRTASIDVYQSPDGTNWFKSNTFAFDSEAAATSYARTTLVACKFVQVTYTNTDASSVTGTDILMGLNLVS